jgi:hypothetical protein
LAVVAGHVVDRDGAKRLAEMLTQAFPKWSSVSAHVSEPLRRAEDIVNDSQKDDFGSHPICVHNHGTADIRKKAMERPSLTTTRLFCLSPMALPVVES